MTSTEAYKKLLLKINKNDTNADIDISKGEFVLLFNEQSIKWLSQKISGKESTKNAQDLQELYIKSKSLQRAMSYKAYEVFLLPKDFFSYIASYSLAGDTGCSSIRLSNYPFKPANENMLLEDANSIPSLEYEETIVDLSEGCLYVYKDKFFVEEQFLSYYKEPLKIDLPGYIRIDGSQSINTDPDLVDINVDEVLDRCALEIIRRYENPDGFQLAQERLQQEKK